MVDDSTMINLDTSLAKNTVSIRKILHHIIEAVLHDVRDQFSCGKIDPTVQNLQTVLEKSVCNKLQEEEIVSVMDISAEENSANLNCNGYEVSLLNGDGLGSEEKDANEMFGSGNKQPKNETNVLKKELKTVQKDVREASMQSYKNSIYEGRDTNQGQNGLSYDNILEKENRQLKHKLKCMECNYESLKKNYMNEVDRNGLANPRNRKNVKESEYELPPSPKTRENVKRHDTSPDKNFKGVNILEDNLNLNSLLTQVEVLTEQIDLLKSKKTHVEDDIDMKESKILSLQSTIDKMKIILLECKTKEHNLSLQLDYANVTIDKLQRSVAKLGKEKAVLQKSVERITLKSTYLQNQWDGATTVTKQKDKEIQALQCEKEVLVGKLKEKNDRLREQELSGEKLRKDLNEVKEGYSKLDQSIGNLKRNYSQLEKNSNVLRHEKKCVEKQLEDVQTLNQHRMKTFLKQLNISEDGIDAHLKEMVKDVDVGAIAEKLVTKLRIELDSLRTNMHWLKEALELSEKDRTDLQSQLEVKRSQVTKLDAKLGVSERTNQNLNETLHLHQLDTSCLQKALQKAFVGYDGLCSMLEKKERSLEKERETKNRSKKSNEKSVRRTSFQLADSGCKFLTEDICSMLNNIKGHLSSTLNSFNNKLEQTDRDLSKTHLSHDLSGIEVIQHTDAEEEVSVCENTQGYTENIAMSNTTLGTNSQKLNDYLQMHTSQISRCSSVCSSTDERTITEPSKSLLHSFIPIATPFREKKNGTGGIGGTGGTGGTGGNDTTLVPDVTDVSQCSSVASTFCNDTVSGKQPPASNDSDAVVKLRERLSHLAEMGTNLQTNNTELCEMMKVHSRKMNMLKKSADQNTLNK